MTNKERVEELLSIAYRDSHKYPELTATEWPDKFAEKYAPEILHLIEEAEREAFKKGYIDGGISILAPKSKNPSPSKGLAELKDK